MLAFTSNLSLALAVLAEFSFKKAKIKMHTPIRISHISICGQYSEPSLAS